MGGWIATLAAMRLRETDRNAIAGLVLIAPAIDFTERLMWDAFPETARRALVETGLYLRPSAYSAEPYPITRRLIEEGRSHLILDGPVEVGCPVHVLQGMRDEDVPWRHALRFVEALPGESVQLTLVKDGDHRLARPQDLERLTGAIDAMSRTVSRP
jgi:pimeloyl-ACP methyl ester carboxylesterase